MRSQVRDDFDPDTIARKARELGNAHVEVKGQGTLARGGMARLFDAGGLSILRGCLYGQRALSARTEGTPGLNIELRLQGRSASCRLTDGHRLALDAGEMLIVGDGEAAAWRVRLPHQPAFETVSLQLTEAFLAGRAAAGDPLVSAACAWIAERRVRTAPLAQGLRPLAHRLMHIAPGAPGTALLCEAAALECLARIAPVLGLACSQDNAGEALARAAHRVIFETARVDLSVSALAQRMAVSVSTLERALGRDCGQPPAALIREAALEGAARLLRDGVPLRVVAGETGYGTPEALAKAFRRRFGVPPSRMTEPDRSAPDTDR